MEYIIHCNIKVIILNDKNRVFLTKQYQQYYIDHFDKFHIPDNIHQREFGIQSFGFDGMRRHLSFDSNDKFKSFINNNVPSDVYCSNASYLLPDQPMKDKGLQYADMIFDIDAQDFDLSCRKNHTVQICKKCQGVNCDCTSKKVKKSLYCVQCLNIAKQETKKLVKILYDELGMRDIKVYFSGNEGFHIHVHDTQYNILSSKERGELVDYIMFKHIIPDTFGITKHKSKLYLDSNWGKRLSKYIKHNKIKLSSKTKYYTFQDQLKEISKVIGIKIDPQVTMDIHRIFRMPGSINSKSGMTKLYIDNIDDFDIYHAMLINDKPTSITVKNINIQLFDLNIKQYMTVPANMATYMISKGVADI